MANPTRRLREEVKSLLENLFGDRVAAVYSFMPSTFDNKTPIVVVSTGGRQPHRDYSIRAKDRRVIIFITIATLYNKPNDSYGPGDAADIIDDLMDDLDIFLDEYSTHPDYWTDVTMPDFSEQYYNEKNNVPYIFEVIPLVFELV